MDWLATAITLAIIVSVITATVLLIRHREEARKIAREAEHLNVVPNDTRRAFGMGAATHSGADRVERVDRGRSPGSEGDVDDDGD